jgi:hypothetical protein
VVAALDDSTLGSDREPSAQGSDLKSLANS